MKSLDILSGSLFTGIFLLGITFSAAVSAHQVGNQNGHVNHQHVYKRNSFGNGVTAGHYSKPAGSQGIVIWQATPSRAFTKPQPGFKVPSGHTRQPTQKQMFQQKPSFVKAQNRTPDLGKR